jgi:hypothetical protein
MYMMTVAEMMPTAKPAITRPAIRRPMFCAAVWRTTPTTKIMQARMMDKRRPIMSAKLPAKRAPKKVPADRIEVMSDFSQVWML